MKKFICVLLLICMAFAACDLGNNGNNGTETISIDGLSIKDTGIKSLYVSNIPVNNGRAAGGSTIQTLSYINSNGKNSPFFFVSPSGKNIVLNVSEIRQLDNKRISVNFASYYEIIVNEDGSGIITYTIGETISIGDGLNTWKTALLDMESGKVYDFSNWDIYIIKDNIIIASGRDATIYKIDFNNISVATPLNNREFFWLTGISPPVIFDNKIIGHTDVFSDFVIDINNAFPIQPIKNGKMTKEMCSFITNDFEVRLHSSRTGFIMQDLSGDTWFIRSGGRMSDLGYDTGFSSPEKYFIGKITINDNANVSLIDYFEGSFSFTPTPDSRDYIFPINSIGNGIMMSGNSINENFILIYQNGFVKFERKAVGIQVESVVLSMPTNLNGIASFIQNNYLYYLEGTSIKRLYLSTGNNIETIYTNSRLISSGTPRMFLTPIEDKIIFYQFADDNTSVNTYSLSMYKPNAEPELLSSVSADIRNIIELDF